MAFLVAAMRSIRGRDTAYAALSAAGHTVVLFSDGAPALAEILAGRPDAVVVEDRLGAMTARQLCTALRADPATADIPVIVCGTPRRTAAGARAAGPGDAHVGTADLATGLPEAIARVLADGRRPRSPAA